MTDPSETECPCPCGGRADPRCDRCGLVVFELTPEFFFGDGTKTMVLGADFMSTGEPARPYDEQKGPAEPDSRSGSTDDREEAECQ